MPQENMSAMARYPMEVKALGVLQHGRLKHNMFSVLWSDHNDMLIYRIFEDFKKLQRQLKKKFPLESGLFRKSENIIPKLRDVPLFRRNRKTNRFIERLRLLETYSRELLKTDGKISQCKEVMQFFTPRSHDLNPSFPADSLVIMPSETKDEKSDHPRPLSKPPATQPMVSQQYMCIEDYETKDTKNRPFKVKRHERLGVLIKESSGWWLVENEEKHLAWFPAPYLKDLETHETDSGMDSDDDGILYYAKQTYEATSTDEISITIGVLVEVIEKSNNGWWLVRYNGRAGYVPSMFLQPYRNYQQLQAMIKQGKYSSTPNLFKATSTLNLNTFTKAWKSQEGPCVEDQGRDKEMKLDRKKSRSLSLLPTNTEPKAASLLASELDNLDMANVGGRTQNVDPDWEPSPLQRNRSQLRAPSTKYNVHGHEKRDKVLPLTRQLVTDRSDEDIASSGRSELPTRQPNSHSPPRTPQVPQRPKTHEILHKCTTVTKNALQGTARSAEPSELSETQK